MTLNFPLLLVIAVAVCGALALVDLVLFAPRRRAAISSYEGQVNEPDPAVLEKLNKEPLLVEYGKSFFPVLFIVLVLRSFLVETVPDSLGVDETYPRGRRFHPGQQVRLRYPPAGAGHQGDPDR